MAFHTMSVVRSDQQKRYTPSLRAVEEAKIANSKARRGVPKSPESIVKRTETRRKKGNYSRTEESIQKGIETRRRNNTLSYGTFSENHRKKLSEAKKKPIKMYTEGYEYLRTFESASKAADEIGGTVSSISKAARTPLGVYKNFRWDYEL